MNGNRQTDPQSTVSPSSSGSRLAEPRGNLMTAPSNGYHNGTGGSRSAREDHRGPSRFDGLSLTLAVARQWHWLLTIACILTLAGWWAAFQIWDTVYLARTQLVYQAPAYQGEAIHQSPPTAESLAQQIQSPKLLRRVAEDRNVPLSWAEFSKQLEVVPDPRTGMIQVTVRTKELSTSIARANLFSDKAVEFTRQLQSQRATDVVQFLNQQLDELDREIAQLEQRRQQIQTNGFSRPQSNQLTASLQAQLAAAYDELANLRAEYTEAHPLMQRQEARIDSLREQLNELDPSSLPAKGASDNPDAQNAPATTQNPASPNLNRSTRFASGGEEPDGGVDTSPEEPNSAGSGSGELDLLQSQLESLKEERLALQTRLRNAQVY